MNISVSELYIKLSDSISEKFHSHDSSFTLTTKGPLRLFRQYNSKGGVNFNNNGWDYYLVGIDRGKAEKKLIKYSYSNAPVILEFIDDKGIKPIDIYPEKDKESIDPFSLLLNIINELKSDDKCSINYSIFDGKRRYIIDVNQRDQSRINQKPQKENRYKHCELTYLGSDEKAWPFTSARKAVEIWFDPKKNYIPVKFSLKTPIGKIIGHLIPNP
jgi:hypothetical protein